MCTRRWELVARVKSAVITEPFLNATVVEDSESYGCFSDPACTRECKGFQVFSVADHLSIRSSRPKQTLGGGGGGGDSPRGMLWGLDTVGSVVFIIASLTWVYAIVNILSAMDRNHAHRVTVLGVSTSLTCQPVPTNLRDHHLGIDCKLGLKGGH